MTDRLAELGALQYAVENLSTAGTSPNRLALAGYIHAAYTDYQAWAAANPGVNPNRLSAKGRLYGYFYDHASWSPLSLFASSEVGAWYDPSDLTTMFQDRAGTTPVTADGQTVGLILDKSKGLALGSELVTNGDFSSATGWSVPSGVVIGSGVATATAANGYLYRLGNSIVAGRTYEVSFNVSGYSGTATIRGYIQASPVFGSTVSGNGHFTHRLTATTTNANSECGLNMSSGFNGVIDNFSIKEIAGNHAVAPSDAARPLYKTDGTYHWLQFDGVDDSLSTAAINFTGTNKMSVFLGARKASDAARGIFVELGATYASAGNFGQEHSDGAGANWRFTTPQGALQKIIAAPKTAVTTMLLDNAAASNASIARWNGVQELQNFVGPNYNFSNNSLNIGRRADGTLPMNGNIYSMIVRGALSTADEITATETWVNSKTGAF